MIESAMAVRFAGGASLCSSNAALPNYRPRWSSDDSNNTHFTSFRIPHSRDFHALWNRFQRVNGGSFIRKKLSKYKVRACAEQMEPVKPKGTSRYHPSEEIRESASHINEDARLLPAETTRTIIEVNSKATLLFSGLFNDEIEEETFWPELPYVTDEHGNIYFKVNNDEEILQNLALENNFVQVIVGLDSMQLFNNIELSGPSEIDFGIEEIEDEDSDVEGDVDDEEEDDDEDEDYDEDWVSVLDDEDDLDDSDEALGDWAKLETMRYSHPMYFARRISEVASDHSFDWMVKPPVGLAIQGFLTPASIGEHSVIQKQRLDNKSGDNSSHSEKKVKDNLKVIGRINGVEHGLYSEEGPSPISSDELHKDENPKSGTSFFKLEMIKIQLLSAQRNPTFVDVEDYKKAKPDAIAHSAPKIISRLKANGKKTAQALKALCWRCKSIQVEEAALISVDSLGFDLRVCSGTQVQTLRFAFDTRATSEYSAERQLNDLLFPRTNHKPARNKQPQQNEC